jgi:hypothetical protein
VTRGAFTETLWRFVRGDLPPAAFDQWICTTPEVEQELGPDLHMRAISARYTDWDEIDAMKAAIESFLRASASALCACLEMRDLHVVMMGEHRRLFATLDEVSRRGAAFWWLSIHRCSACRQWWLVAGEERQNDVFCLRRMSDDEAASALDADAWPSDFDRYETLINLAIAAGITFRFVDPMDTRHTMADLARERPGIRVSELARLLSLDSATAATVARHVVASEGVGITFDAPLSDDERPSRRK